MTAPIETENDLDLLEETVEVEQPRRVIGGSIASFVVLTIVAVGGGIAGITALAFYGLPAVQTIGEFFSGR